MRIPLACCLLCCVLAVDLFIYFSSLPSLFSISIWTSFVSSCLFLVGTMLSPRFRFLLRLVWHITCILVRTCADLTFLFFGWGIRFVSVIVCIIFGFLFVFPPEVIFRTGVIGACPVTTDCIVTMSSCENNNCTVPYCTVLYCTVLYCTVLYCTVLCCTTVLFCSPCQTIWTRGLPTRDSSSITGLVLDKSFPSSFYIHGVILKRPRDRQHGVINPDPPATAQLRHAITWKPYGLVPFFGYRSMAWTSTRMATFTCILLYCWP